MDVRFVSVPESTHADFDQRCYLDRSHLHARANQHRNLAFTSHGQSFALIRIERHVYASKGKQHAMIVGSNVQFRNFVSGDQLALLESGPQGLLVVDDLAQIVQRNSGIVR